MQFAGGRLLRLGFLLLFVGVDRPFNNFRFSLYLLGNRFFTISDAAGGRLVLFFAFLKHFALGLSDTGARYFHCIVY